MESKENPQTSEDLIAIFPLPATVFFPNTLLPLHIFEPRYRQMVEDALDGNRKIGMILLKPGWEADYHGNPEIVSVGCVGSIDRHVRQPDGKYNILLEGLSRFRIVREESGKLYRRAHIRLLQENNDQDLGPVGHPLKDELIKHFREYTCRLPEDNKLKKDVDWDSFKKLSAVADNMAYRFEPTVEQKQNFLEELDVRRRIETLHSLIDLKIKIIKLSKFNIRKGVDARMN